MNLSIVVTRANPSIDYKYAEPFIDDSRKITDIPDDDPNRFWSQIYEEDFIDFLDLSVSPHITVLDLVKNLINEDLSSFEKHELVEVLQKRIQEGEEQFK